MLKPYFEDWGLIDYEQALQKQVDLVEAVSQDPSHPGFLIFCTHPAVVTTGRQTKPEDIFAWQGPVVEVSRGGRATYHGPSQLVVYPILNLKFARHSRGPQEVRGYLRALEQAIVETLKEFGISAAGKAEAEETGVWVFDKKIASLGIAVKKWISYHGAAINLTFDPQAFAGMNPCGFKSDVMTSAEQQLGKPVDVSAFSKTLKMHLEQLL